jgi:hypothetical protein
LTFERFEVQGAHATSVLDVEIVRVVHAWISMPVRPVEFVQRTIDLAVCDASSAF